MTPELLAIASAGLVALLALIGTTATAVLTRRSSRESTQADGWAKLTGAHQEEIRLLHAGQDELRRDVAAIREDLQHEVTQRQTLAEILRSAWRYIERLNEQIRAMGSRPDPAPADLVEWMHRDGLIVDRVETTYSHTVVSDSRDPGPGLVEVAEEMQPYDGEDGDASPAG